MRKLLMALSLVLLVGCAGTQAAGSKKSVDAPPPAATHEEVLDKTKEDLALESLERWWATEALIFESFMAQQLKSDVKIYTEEVAFVNNYTAAIILIHSKSKLGTMEMYLVVTIVDDKWNGQAIVMHNFYPEPPFASTEAQGSDEKL